MRGHPCESAPKSPGSVSTDCGNDYAKHGGGDLTSTTSGPLELVSPPAKARWKLILKDLLSVASEKAGPAPDLTGLHNHCLPDAPCLGNLRILQCLSDLAPSCYHTTETFYFS